MGCMHKFKWIHIMVPVIMLIVVELGSLPNLISNVEKGCSVQLLVLFHLNWPHTHELVSIVFVGDEISIACSDALNVVVNLLCTSACIDSTPNPVCRHCS